jgi:ribosomal protein S18 acetylase RimI-like enzyme
MSFKNYRMTINVQQNCSDINWTLVPEILKMVGMGYHEASVHQKAFENSASVVFIFHEKKMIGFGRAISDGTYQAAIYDVAVLPEYQRKGIGKLIIKTIVSSLPGCNFILYANVGKEEFYEKLNFRKMKTAMGLFTDPEAKEAKGMIE